MRCPTYLAWRNATPFGTVDPQFGLDIGFFVFSYPWWRFVLSFVFTGLIFSAIAAGGGALHDGRDAVQRPPPGRHAGRAGAPVDPGRAGRAAAGRRLLVRPVRAGDQSNSTIFTGINYTADHATVNAKMILAVIAGIAP